MQLTHGGADVGAFRCEQCALLPAAQSVSLCAATSAAARLTALVMHGTGKCRPVSKMCTLLHAGRQSILGCSSAGFSPSAADTPLASPPTAATNAAESSARRGSVGLAMHVADAPCRTAGASGAV